MQETTPVDADNVYSIELSSYNEDYSTEKKIKPITVASRHA